MFSIVRVRRSRPSLRLPTSIPFVVLVVGSFLLVSSVAPDAQQRAGVHRVDRPLTGRYIVVLRGGDDPLAVGTAAAGLHRGRLRHVYNTTINGFAAELPEAAARALTGDPRVVHVEEDGVVMLAAAAAQGLPSWGLDRINQRTLPLDADVQISGDGTGVNVHVIDTGIRVSHAEFGGRAFIGGDYVDSNGDGNDCHGHGTHVAGTIGGATYGVAKNVTLWAHRVLDCTGAGSTSALIAAVDAITQDSRRPAVANLSLAAPASPALDAAVNRSIASGVTYVVAAGNGGLDAASLSPARVAGAITVGATRADDRRASFSNFGTAVDLFAPGQSITSASIANDTAMATMSGTSMAAAHVAGVAALHLGDHPNASPASVQSAVIASASTGVLSAVGPGSPDRLLFSQVSAEDASEMPEENVSEMSEESAEVATGSEVTVAATTTPYVTLVSPNGGENWGVGSRQQIRWKHNLGDTAQMRIAVSYDGGATYSVIASAARNKASSGTFNWVVTGPRTTSARIRVSWTGGKAADVSDKSFTIAAPFVRVTAPNGGETWTIGSTAKIAWTDNLGPTDKVEIRLSTNGGSSYPTILASTKSDGSHSVSVQSAWRTSSARVRVTWPNNTRVTDASNNNFRVASATTNQPPSVSLTAPASGATFTAPASITISASASDTDGTIARVDFYRGSTLIASDTTSPYSVTWKSVPAGSYSLTAKATDNAGASATSAARSITVKTGTTNQPPSVSLSAPANGASFTAPANITVSASASDTDGTIARVDFYRGSTLIGSDTTSPYSITWSNVAAGSYSLTARAMDNAGATTTSAARTITVSSTTTNQKNVVFTASPDHKTLVNSYLLEIFRAGDNTATAAPLVSRDLGKPPVSNGECTADVTTTINALASGTYQVTISAVGSGGKARSAPFSFTR